MKRIRTLNALTALLAACYAYFGADLSERGQIPAAILCATMGLAAFVCNIITFYFMIKKEFNNEK